jgi:cell pole-organizing protein PopZ
MTAPTPPVPSDHAEEGKIDDIMSSIRASVATESTKVGQGNEDLINAADEEDDVLELTPAELAPAAPEAAAPATEASDEFDQLLAQIGEEKQQRAAAIQAQKEALLADIEPLGNPANVAPAVPEATVPMPVPSAPLADAAERPADASSPAAVAEPSQAAAVGQQVSLLPGSDGLQLVLPTEVLAVALRPMVQGWLEANLPKVVEQLVQAEIAKLN